MKKILITLILFSPISLFGQDEYSLGENDFTEELEKTTLYTSFNPNEYPNLKDSVDLSHLMPPAGDQGRKGSCWAWATTYILRSLMDNNKSFLVNNRLNTNNVYSPEYPYQLYKGGKNDCNWGATSKDMLSKVLKDGAVKYVDFPYNEKLCNIQISPSLKGKAKQFTKKDYIVESVDDLFSIQKVLSEDGQPLILSIKLDDFFCGKGNITATSPFWNNFHTRRGSHAMVIVGYNKRLQALKVLNSWGEDFGDKGYVWISFSIINSAMNYACYPKKALENFPVTENSIEEPANDELTKFNGRSLSTWFKQGYYRPYNNLKVVLAKINTRKGFSVVEIRDVDYNLLTNFYIDVNSSKEFYVNGIRYKFTFDNIDKAGKNPFTKAAYFTIEPTKL